MADQRRRRAPAAPASRPGPSTPARSPTRPPARSCRRSRWPPRSPRPAVGRAPGLRVRPQRQPDPRGARGVPARRSRAPRHGLAFASGLAAEDAMLRLLGPGDRRRARQRRLRRHLPAHRQGARHRPAWPWTAADLDRPRRASPRRGPTAPGVVWVETPDQPRCSSCVDIAAVAEPWPTTGARSCVVDNTFATPVPAAAARARRRRRRALDHQVPRRALRRRRRLRRHRRRRAGRAARLPPERRRRGARARSTATWCCGASRRWPCAWTATATTPGPWPTSLGRPPGRRPGAVPGAARPPRPRRGRAADARLRRHGVSFTLRGRRGRRAGAGRAATGVFTLAESLGAVESLIEHPGRMTHASAAGSPARRRPRAGAPLGRHRDGRRPRRRPARRPSTPSRRI